MCYVVYVMSCCSQAHQKHEVQTTKAEERQRGIDDSRDLNFSIISLKEIPICRSRDVEQQDSTIGTIQYLHVETEISRHLQVIYVPHDSRSLSVMIVIKIRRARRRIHGLNYQSHVRPWKI